MADALVHDAPESHPRILLIDGETEDTPERTWCFWSDPDSIYASWARKKWQEVEFKGPQLVKVTPLSKQQYVMLNSGDFRRRMFERLQGRVEVLSGRVTAMNEGESEVEVVVNGEGRFLGKHVFSSVWNRSEIDPHQDEPWIEQHFIGWFIETDEDIFHADRFTMMDFSIAQHGRTGFMYVLPFSKRSALFEYTVFSKDLLDDEAYEREIESYLNQRTATNYRVVGKERGSIPMTTYPFHHRNTTRIHYIGTAGGWTKASTGYTFEQSAQLAHRMIACLRDAPHAAFAPSRLRSRFFDRVMLDLLSHHNAVGALFFESLYRHHSLERILRFLREETSLWEDLMIILRSQPRGLLLRSVWRVLFSRERK